MILFKKEDSYIEVDDNFSNEELDTFEKYEDKLEDTLEISLNLLEEDSYEK